MLLLHVAALTTQAHQWFLCLGHSLTVTVPRLAPFQCIIQEAQNDQSEPLKQPAYPCSGRSNRFSVNKALCVAHSPLT